MKLAEELAKRKTRNATWLAVLISGAYMVHNFYYFYNRIGQIVHRPYGFVIEISGALLLSSLGLWAIHSGKKSGFFWLLLGGALLYYLSPLAFIIALPVPITWFMARFVFKHVSTTAAWAFIIPILVCVGTWFGGHYFAEPLHRFSSQIKIKKEVKTPRQILYATVTAPGGARLRSGPSMRSAVIATLGAGEVVAILGEENGWYKVQHQKAGQSQIGYVYHSLAEIKSGTSLSELLPPSERTATLSASGPKQIEMIDNFIEAADQRNEQGAPTTTESGKKTSSNNNLLSQKSILGKWEGTLGEQLLLLVIESLEANQCIGYSEVRWKGSTSTLKMDILGQVNPETLEIKFLQKQQGSVIGTFEGALSLDGRSMSGIWKFEEDPAQKYSWSVHKSSNSLH